MSRTLWLHLGSFKSGSSRIQLEAWRQRDELMRGGWLYPLTGLVTDEPDVGHRHSRLVYDRWDEERWSALIADLATEVGGSDAHSVLLSSEAWSDPFAAPALTKVVTALREAGVVDDVRGVLYLRNRHDYARSLYREMTRRRANVRPLPEYIELPRRRRMLDPLIVVRTLTKALAPRSLEVFPYEGAGDVGQHFFGLLGLAAQTRPHAVNASLDSLEAEAYRQVKLLAPELRDRWPGLYAVTSREQWPDDVSERIRPDQLPVKEGWRRRFRRLTGWSSDDVDRMLAPAPEPASDVLAWSDDIRRVVTTWAKGQPTEPAAPA